MYSRALIISYHAVALLQHLGQSCVLSQRACCGFFFRRIFTPSLAVRRTRKNVYTIIGV